MAPSTRRSLLVLVAMCTLTVLTRWHHDASTANTADHPTSAATLKQRILERAQRLGKLSESMASEVGDYAKRIRKGQGAADIQIAKKAAAESMQDDFAPPPHERISRTSDEGLLYPEHNQRSDKETASQIRDHLAQRGVHVDRGSLLKLIQPSKRDYRDFLRHERERPRRPPPPAPLNFVLDGEGKGRRRGANKGYGHGAHAREHVLVDREAEAAAFDTAGDDLEGLAIADSFNDGGEHERMSQGNEPVEESPPLDGDSPVGKEGDLESDDTDESDGEDGDGRQQQQQQEEEGDENDDKEEGDNDDDEEDEDATPKAKVAADAQQFPQKDGNGILAAFANAINPRVTVNSPKPAVQQARQSRLPNAAAPFRRSREGELTAKCFGAPSIWDPLTQFARPPPPVEHDPVWEAMHPTRLRPPPPPPPEFRKQLPGLKTQATHILGKRYNKLADVQDALREGQDRTHMEANFANLKNGKGAADLLHDVKWIERHGQPKNIMPRPRGVRVLRRRHLMRAGGSFHTASRGGRHGVSCDPDAPAKARQACAENRALERCAEEEEIGNALHREAVGGNGDGDSDDNVDTKPLTDDERALASCLKDISSCEASKQQLRRAARKLEGLRRFIGNIRPQCFVQHRGGGAMRGCAPLLSNNETALYMGGCGEHGGGPSKGCDTKIAAQGHAGAAARRSALPLTDELRTRRLGRCAVVGNSMNLFRSANGEAIDAHDAVIRFNNEGDRMAFSLGVPVSKLGKHIGKRTTLRLLNRKYTNQLLDEEVKKGEMDVERDGMNIFWHLYAAPYLAHIQKMHPTAPMRLMATDLVNWQLAAYSALRVDLLRLGLGPFPCYRSLSSGMHGLLLSFLVCESVDVFGFSVDMHKFKSDFNHGRPSESHSWELETMLLRLFYVSGLVNVCNR